MQSGIYSITNIVNSKIYIGSAKNLNKRQIQHYSNLRNNRHTNKYLQNAFNKYGKNNFIFDIIQLVENEENLIFYEQKWMDLTLCSYKKYGYNLTIIADRPMIGRTISKEHKEIIRIRNSGENNHWFGKRFSESHKQKLKQARKKQTNRTKKKVGQYDIKGNLIKEWESARKAAHTLGFSTGLISSCCTNRRNHHKGFIWKFL